MASVGEEAENKGVLNGAEIIDLQPVKGVVEAINERLYAECRKAARDELSGDLAQIKEGMARIMEMLMRIEERQAHHLKATQQGLECSSKVSNRITSVIAEQAQNSRSEPPLNENLSQAASVVSRLLPFDEVNEATDFFLGCHFIQDLLLIILEPILDGIPPKSANSKLALNTMKKLFTQNALSHMIIGESSSGLILKMWCKRPLPSSISRLFESKILPYMKLKFLKENKKFDESWSDLMIKLAHKLASDRTRFIEVAVHNSATAAEAISAMYNEDVRFYQSNLHVAGDCNIETFNSYVTWASKLNTIKKKIESTKEGKISRCFPDLDKVFKPMRLNVGTPIKTIKEMSEFICVVASIADKDLTDIHFDPIPSIPDAEKQFRMHSGCIQDMHQVMSVWLPSGSSELANASIEEDKCPPEKRRRRKSCLRSKPRQYDEDSLLDDEGSDLEDIAPPDSPN